MAKSTFVLSLVAVGLGLLAVALAAYSVVRIEAEEQRIADSVYQRILVETHNEIRPAYAELGIEIDTDEPRSFKELLRPLVGVNSSK